jgi:glycosyltransferase involved in cell wall biosynthesis
MGYETETEYLLTIIVPLYNEEGNLPRLAKELSGYLFKTTCKAKVLFVNDGSTDNSAEILEKICSANRRFSFISLGKNSGLSTALKAISMLIFRLPLSILTFYWHIPTITNLSPVSGLRGRMG